MNTNIEYNLVIISETKHNEYVEHVTLDEVSYKVFLKELESKKFITLINSKQDPVTIKVEHINKIMTNISVKTDIILDKKED